MINTDRFWAKVDRRGDDDCWLWRAGKNNMGYGMFGVDYSTKLAHRIAYELLVGSIPAGLVLDHKCRTPLCVNPNHLEPVTQLENVRRGRGHGSETHCPKGHAYDAANTERYRGQRYCRICRSAASSLQWQRKRASITGVNSASGAKPNVIND